MAQGPVAQVPVAQGPVAQGLCGSRALWLKDFVAQRPLAQGPVAVLVGTWWYWVRMERNWLIHDGTWS